LHVTGGVTRPRNSNDGAVRVWRVVAIPPMEGTHAKVLSVTKYSFVSSGERAMPRIPTVVTPVFETILRRAKPPLIAGARGTLKFAARFAFV